MPLGGAKNKHFSCFQCLLPTANGGQMQLWLFQIWFGHIVYVQSYYNFFLFTVTYFVTYGTAIACYAYFVLTRQDYLLPDVRDRQYLLNFHKRARKSEWDISKYNSLKEGICRAEVELSKLKDHTKLRLLEINRLKIFQKLKCWSY